MAGQRDCDSAVIAGRMSKAIEFFDAADLLGKEVANAAGDLYIDAGIAASDVICCDKLLEAKRGPGTVLREHGRCCG